MILAEVIDREDDETVQNFLSTVDPERGKNFWIGLSNLEDPSRYLWNFSCLEVLHMMTLFPWLGLT